MAAEPRQDPPDPRRQVPRTDALLALPETRAALDRLDRAVVLGLLRAVQEDVRTGGLAPADTGAELARRLPRRATTLQPLINATGVVVHTNLGRAPLSAAAVEALTAAAGHVDVEFDLVTGARARRGSGAHAALRAALPDAGDVLIVNNGAAALLLALTVLAAGREVIWSRGELVEIGDGFRLPDLAVSTGARIREVGTTNRTRVSDYAEAIGPDTGCILKVHPSNFRVEGYTTDATVADLAAVGVQLVVDIGSGLLAADPLLPHEPHMAGALRAGADLVTASADKLLGGPQAGIVAGAAELIARLRRHPLARALRVDKLTLAALEATLRGPQTPVQAALHADPGVLRRRCEQLAARVGGELVASDGVVGGGGAPGVVLPGWAVALPAGLAATLRLGQPAVVGRVEREQLLLDLRCVPPDQDDAVVAAVLAATATQSRAPGPPQTGPQCT